MRKFITKIALFLMPFFILTYTLDYVISYYLKQTKKAPGEFEVWNDIYNSNVNCDIAIYGSSRAWVHIDPKILSDILQLNVYNFGIDGHNFWLQYLRHIEFLKYNPKPKTIILSVDVFSLQKRSDLYQQEQFLPYMLWNTDIQQYTSSYIGYKKIDYYMPLIRYAGKSSSLKDAFSNFVNNGPAKQYRYRGYKGMEKEWTNDLENAKSQKPNYEVQLNNESIKLFHEFVLKCIAQNIELILVYTPEHIDGQKYVSNRKKIISIYKQISKENKLLFLDFSGDEICYKKEFFYNSMHLNKKGAEIFSKKLAEQVKTFRTADGN